MTSFFDQFNSKIELHSKVLVMPKERSTKAYVGVVTSFSNNFIYVSCLTNTPNYPTIKRVGTNRIVVLDGLNDRSTNERLLKLIDNSN